ncbi:hypothetical protein LLG96_17635 [bacterium]|nr:hypothetical protein [bacterium]
MYTRLSICTALAVFMISPGLYGQTLTPQRIVDAPTAGSLPSKTVMLETHLFDGGGVTQTASVAVTDLIGIGCSYSGAGVIGAGRVTWQPHAAFQLRIRVIEESLNSPAVSIGFDSQGYGPYIKGAKLNRFRTKSRGVYLVVSRNYRLLGDLGFHGGVNYSFEDDDGDKDPSFWAGIDKDIGHAFELCGEYDFATNDNENKSITSNRGYLNGALKWHLGGAFTLELDVKNILRNTKKDISGYLDEQPEPSRELRFSYHKTF